MTVLTAPAETRTTLRQAQAQDAAVAYARAVIGAAREGRDPAPLWDALCTNVGTPAASLFVAKILLELDIDEHTFVGAHPLPGYTPTLPGPDQVPPHPYAPGNTHLCQCTCAQAAAR